MKSRLQLLLTQHHVNPWIWGTLLAALLPLMFQSGFFYRVAHLALLSAIYALSLQLLFGKSGQISLGHAIFVMAGAYTTAVLTRDYGLPVFVGISLGVLVGASIGATIAPIGRLRGGPLAIATLALNAAAVVVVANIEWLHGPLGIPAIPPLGIAELTIESRLMLYYVLLSVVLIIAWCLHRTVRFRFGRALLALRGNETVAASCGISTARFKVKAFALSAAVAAFGGALFAHTVSYINPRTFSIELSIMIIAMVIIGGVGSWGGAVIGAVIVTGAPEYLRIADDYRLLIFGIFIAVFLIFAPGGVASMFRKATQRVYSALTSLSRESRNE